MADEARLREIVRDGWPEKLGDPIWVEAANGGTVGAMDVFLPMGKRRGYLPVELKWWRIDMLGSIFYRARPAQIRLHTRAAKAKQRTAFLALLSNGDIVALPGWGCVHSWAGAKDITLKVAHDGGFDADRVLDHLLRDSFWKGAER